jgi:cation transport regulator
MPYRDITDLPGRVKTSLPRHAQHIYKEAFNHAYDQYKNQSTGRVSADREEIAHKVAWSAVKHKYHKGSDNKWHPA